MSLTSSASCPGGRRAGLAAATVAAVLMWSAVADAQPATASSRPADGAGRSRTARPRRRPNPLVRLFAACQDSVVTLVATRTKTSPASRPASGPAGGQATVTQTERGTGFLIHPDGYLLTSSHFLRHGGDLQAVLSDRTSLPVRVVARDDSLDVALMKVDAPGKLNPLALGRSADLMVGQDVAVLGNPFNFGVSLGAGIVTGLDRSTRTDFTLLSGAIQTNAGINPGVSGGPLLDLDGLVVGLAASQRRDADGIGFAVAIDDVRAAFADLVSAEARYGFVLGLSIDPAADRARVSAVADNSPAAAAGVKAGDIVTAVGEAPVADSVAFHLALIGRTGGQKLVMKLDRAGAPQAVTVTLRDWPLSPAVDADGLHPGLFRAVYRGQWERLPDFARLTPGARSVVKDFRLKPWAGKEGFAMEFAGLVRVPADGVYTFYAASDDGSRLYVDDRLVVDNDGLHAAHQKHGLARLRAGCHRLRVTFFESIGDEELSVLWEGPNVPKQPLPASALFHKPAPAPTTAPVAPTTAGAAK